VQQECDVYEIIASIPCKLKIKKNEINRLKLNGIKDRQKSCRVDLAQASDFKDS